MKLFLNLLWIILLFISCYKTDPQVLSLLNEIKQQNENLKIQISTLQTRTDSLSNAIKSTNLTLSSIDKKVDSLKLQINIVLQQINQLNAQIATANTNIRDLQAKNEELKIRLDELKLLLEELRLICMTSSSLKVTTTISNISSSPLVVGGIVEVVGMDSVYEKGIIISTDTILTIDNSYSNFYYSPSPTLLLNLYTGGWIVPSNSKITLKSKVGRGSYSLNLQGAYGNTTYYVRAYAKNAKNIFYGDTKIIKSAVFSRDSRSLDVANVFWKQSFNLFDLLTDEIILPNASGVYSFWYSSNEDPRVFSTTRTSATLPGFLFYKFKTQESCQRWCDLKTGRVVPAN